MISSAGVMLPWGISGDYNATKAALEAYGRELAHEFGPRGITVNMIRPGATATEILEGSGSEPESLPILLQPRRFARPQDIAEAVGYLAGTGGAYTTGSVVTVDGGLTV
jgi:NAD(P)-dependent dehydrogenase (short-subunit alcohol dehydrogenase family)